MAGPTYYQLMMLDPSASRAVINAVYRVLAKQYHPDRAGAAGARKMALLNEAYAVLSDPEKRARYDEKLRISGRSDLVAIKVDPDEDPAEPGHAWHRSSSDPATQDQDPGGEPPPWSMPGTDKTAADPEFGEAGAPPSYLPRRGTAISFGRYRGWTVSQVAAIDRDYVQWLSRTMAGRSYRDEAMRILGQTA